MTTRPPCSRRRARRVAGPRTGSALLVLLTAVILGCAPSAAASVAVEPARTSSSTASPSPPVPTPTKHSYDDADIEQRSEGSSPAPWILMGALAGLVVIGIILLRAGQSSRDHHG